VTDVATGWTQARTVMGKGERGVAAALGQIQLELPFHLAGIHSDNGSEFINHHLAKWVDARQITFTRSRPANKNDNAYGTGSGPADQFLLWQKEVAHLALELPELVEQVEFAGGVVAEVAGGSPDDRPVLLFDAKTPARRLQQDHPGHLNDQDRAAITHTLGELNPAQLRREIASTQNQLIHLARQRGPVPSQPYTQAIYTSGRKTDRKTAHKRAS